METMTALVLRSRLIRARVHRRWLQRATHTVHVRPSCELADKSSMIGGLAAVVKSTRLCIVRGIFPLPQTALGEPLRLELEGDLWTLFLENETRDQQVEFRMRGC